MVILNLSVDPAAQPGTTYITVATGLEIVTAANLLNVAAARPNQVSLRVPIVNAVTGLAGVPGGGTARIVTTGLPADLTGWTLTVGPLPAAFTADANGVLTVQVPNLLGVGEQPVQLIPPREFNGARDSGGDPATGPAASADSIGRRSSGCRWRSGSGDRLESGSARRERDLNGLRAFVAQRDFTRRGRSLDKYRRGNLSGDYGDARTCRSRLDGATVRSGLGQLRGSPHAGLGSSCEQSERAGNGRNGHSLVGGVYVIHSARAATATSRDRNAVTPLNCILRRGGQKCHLV